MSPVLFTDNDKMSSRAKGNRGSGRAPIHGVLLPALQRRPGRGRRRFGDGDGTFFFHPLGFIRISASRIPGQSFHLVTRVSGDCVPQRLE